jgi:ribosomal protein L22
MTENKQTPKIEKKEEKKMEEKKVAVAQDIKKVNEDKSNTTDNKEIKQEVKSEVKSETKPANVEKKEVKKIAKKEEAQAYGSSLRASKKHVMYISNFIKGKKIDDAIKDLGDVIKLKRVVPFKGEIPHRHAAPVGRYPVNASKIVISVLKGLKGNCVVNGLDLDKTVIYFATANWASRPARKGGAKGKRTNLLLKAKELNAQKEIKSGDKR